MLPIVPSKFKLVVRTIKNADGYKADPSALRQLEVLRRLFSQCEKIIVATDAGREGELIFRYIYDFLECHKPFERLWISSLTDKAIQEGFNNLHPGKEFDNLYYSAKARREADWLVGINASQALSVTAGRSNYSLGRVQTPTLAMICRRYIENRDFNAKSFYQLQLTTSKDSIPVTALHTNRFELKDQAETLLRKAYQASHTQVENIDCKTLVQEAPLLYDLTSLQRDANIRCDFSAEKTLSIAQMLYEKQFISYPRTGCCYIGEDLFEKIPSLIAGLGHHPRFHAVAERMVIMPLNKHCVDDSKLTDHHALIITEKRPEALNSEQQRIYDLIAGRMLESFSEKCIKEVTTVTLTCNGVPFTCKDIEMKYPGWRGVLELKDETEREECITLPQLTAGEKLPIEELKVLEKKTKAAPLYTEASLLGAMESAGHDLNDEAQREAMKECGLGTPATRAGIIELLITRRYIERQGKSLIPTSKGLEVFEIVKDRRIADVEMTGMWELALGKIREGEIRPITFNSSIDTYTRQIVSELLSIPFNHPVFATCQCPKCKTGTVRLYEKVAKCDNPDCGLFVFRTINGITLADDSLLLILTGQRTPFLKFISKKNGKSYEAALALDDEYAVRLIFKEKQ